MDKLFDAFMKFYREKLKPFIMNRIWPLLKKVWPLLQKIGFLFNKITPKRKALRIAFYVFLILIVALGGFFIHKKFFKKKKAVTTGDEVFSVRVKAAKKQNFSETYNVMGSIKGAVENELRFEMDGILASYNFHEGSKVLKGQIIATLDPKDAMTKVDFAKSKYISDKATYFSASQRMKVYEELYGMQALSESKIQESRFETESAEAKMKAALSEFELAQSNLGKTNLTAQTDGLLSEILIKPGEYITQQDVVAKFISGENTNFEVDVPEKEVLRIKEGMKVSIVCDAYSDKEFIGAVIEIAPTVKERTRTTTIKISVKDPNNQLRSGMFGRGAIYITQVDNVILVPQESLISLGETTFLVPLLKPDESVSGEGVIELRKVKIGQKMEKSIVIEDGINPGEFLVVETQGQLQDGVRAKYSVVSDEKKDEDKKEGGPSIPEKAEKK
jgi:membrane fusion protein (multidrug efflux system)